MQQGLLTGESTIFDLSVLRLAEMDMTTGIVYKTYADISCGNSELTYVVESSCGTCLRVSDCGQTTLTRAGKKMNPDPLLTAPREANSYVVVSGLATSEDHPALLAAQGEKNGLIKLYQNAFNATVVLSQTLAKAILDLFLGKASAVISPVAELAQIDLLLIEALKSHFQITYTDTNTPSVLIKKHIETAKVACS